ncbi:MULTISPECIES: hypothetical protein [unclassified Streptomyces]|uniref:hypothetical protein n=1 Tax=unclassified Streptomyces TaxID=2593676 RepID=UPI00081D37C8|nr:MULTISPECIES: hypothetical protein [unclassified Streptomyces]MYR93071.1 hypothetical protein [Streptomyces sp. SID4937]SCD45981.1 hypothetical protein GA0115243_102151 [Streptomyces sp. ScaeMP-e83]
MFGLTTTRRLRAEQHKTIGLQARLGLTQGLLQGNQAALDRAEQNLRDEIDAHIATIRAALAAEQTAAAPRPIQHPDELWSLIDWTLWGSGMGDTFRERLADTFLQSITPEDHAQALELIRWWTEDRGRQPLGRRRYEDLRRRLDRALDNVVRWRKAAHTERRTVAVLAEQLLTATSGQSPAARAALGLPEDGPWQRAVDGLNALVDAEIPFHIEPDGHIANSAGDQHIEWDRSANRWRLVHDDEDTQVTVTADHTLIEAIVKGDGR